MTDLRVRSAGAPQPATDGTGKWVAGWGTPEGGLVTASQYDSLVAGGKVFVAHAGTLTAPLAGNDAYVITTPDLNVDVPDGTSIKPLFLQVHYETVGTTLLLETFASISSTLGAQSGGNSVTAASLRNRGGGSSNCAITSAATTTAQSGTTFEFFRGGYQLAEDMAATEDWETRTFKWTAGKNGPAPLVIGDASIAIWAASETTTCFITLVWVEFQGGEF